MIGECRLENAELRLHDQADLQFQSPISNRLLMEITAPLTSALADLLGRGSVSERGNSRENLRSCDDPRQPLRL